jgi:hypothetical protein
MSASAWHDIGPSTTSRLLCKLAGAPRSEGSPDDAENGCYRPALRFKVDADGAITDELEHPIGADARPQGDGKEIAKQKVVAGLLGLGLDEIVRRAERARKRRNRWLAGLAGTFLFLAVVATGSAALPSA